jgi:hypothetical protein
MRRSRCYKTQDQQEAGAVWRAGRGWVYLLDIKVAFLHYYLSPEEALIVQEQHGVVDVLVQSVC